MACHACCTSTEGDTVVFGNAVASDQALIGTETVQSKQELTASSRPGPKLPGEPCTSRLPVIGDIVLCKDSTKMVGHDVAGVEEAWELMPGQTAEVLGVDADGDFRLRNEAGIASGFLFRKDFVYVLDEGSQSQPSILVEGKRQSNAITEAKRTVQPDGERKFSEGGPRFSVELKRTDGEKVGLVLDFTLPDVLGIKSLDPGLVGQHNETAPEHLKILPGYFVLAVNRCSKDKELMIKELLSAPSVKLLLAPRKTFPAKLVKNPDLGLHLAHCQGGPLLLIHDVLEGGACADYNAKAPADHQLRSGDLIDEVNGFRGDAAAMMVEIKAKDELNLVVARPCR